MRVQRPLQIQNNRFCEYSFSCGSFFQRSQPTSQGQETSKPISSVSKQSSTDNHTTIVHHKPEGM